MNLFSRIMFSMLLISSLAQAKVIESNRYADVLQYVGEGTLVVTDLDNTVIRPAQTIGSDQWGMNVIAKLKKAGLPDKEAKDIGVSMFATVQSNSKVRTVEVTTISNLHRAIEQGSLLLGLTARPLYLVDVTMKQLKSVQFPLLGSGFRSTPATGVIEQNKVIFVGPHLNKGEVLREYIKKDEYKNIRRIVFIDDKLHHAQDVDKALSNSGLEVISIRYGAADAWVKSFDEEKAVQEWEIFQKTGKLCMINDTCEYGGIDYEG